VKQVTLDENHAYWLVRTIGARLPVPGGVRSDSNQQSVSGKSGSGISRAGLLGYAHAGKGGVETARPALLQNLLAVPIVGAPLAGGPTTPALAAAVCEAGGLGFLAAGYKTAVALADDINALRRLTRRPFGVNVF
jgi:hypothetical protein